LRAASESEEDAMEEAAGLVGASGATAMVLHGSEATPAIDTPAIAGTRDGTEGPAASDGPSSRESHQIIDMADPGPETARTSFRDAESSAGSESDSDSDSDSDREARGFRPPVRSPPIATAEGSEQERAVANLLRQLANEPPNEAECAAKFQLYEGYASEVENMRNILFKFKDDSTPSLPPSIVADMERQTKSIDKHESLGIPDDCREWFVYHMMRQAERNNFKMAEILDKFDRKLKYLAQSDQKECPVCLDEFDDGAKKAETLGCCHRVCKECWTNWTKVSHGHPFCPLCRYEDFMSAVASGASRTPVDSDASSAGEDE